MSIDRVIDGGFSLFQQNNGYWYFRYTDADGKRKTYATGTRDHAVALEVQSNFSPKFHKVSQPRTLVQLMELFMDAETNPSYIDAKVTGKSYGIRHSREVARNIRDLLGVLKGNNRFWDTRLDKLSRFDCKQIMLMVHSRWGNTEKAKSTFSQFKVMLNYAATEGWISASPASGMPDIKADPGEDVIPMTVGDIRTILDNPSLFRFHTEPCNEKTRREREGIPEMDYAVFSLMALTGMRRSEVGALTVGQIQSGIYKGRAFHILDIDRAYKDDSWTEVGLPKWGITRAIALPECAYSRLEPYLVGRNPEDRVFEGFKKCRMRTMFERLKHNAATDGIIWEDKEAFDMLSPHKLRHALNTNLLTETTVDSLRVAEYMSWEHQEDLKKVQRRYTHMVASRLLPVADAVDEMFYPKVEVTRLPSTRLVCHL